jgi:putative transcriptional regulator
VRISHHLDEATILAYAAGTLGEALSVVAAAHIAWCPECRRAVRDAEALGAALFDGDDGLALADRALESVMARLPSAPSRDTAKASAFVPAAGLPLPVASRLEGQSLSDIRWRRVAPGVSFHDFPLSNGSQGQLRLMRIAPGKAMPEHGHGGEELTLVLRGSYSDHLGRFGIGDVADLDESIEHRPVVNPEEDCICLVATEAPTRFTSLFARLMQPLVRI